MIRITYLSQETEPWTPVMLLDLLRHCHINNPKLGLTGLLIHGNGSFLQAIEGPEAAVEALVAKIERDPRHKNFRILRRENIDRRSYGGWSMGFQRLSEQMLKEVPELDDFVVNDFNPEFLSENPVAVENLLNGHRSSIGTRCCASSTPATTSSSSCATHSLARASATRWLHCSSNR